MVTLECSSNTPCIVNIIPAMDQMHVELLNACDNENYSSAIWAALKVGKKLLNKYYSITDNSEVYHIAMSTFFILLLCSDNLIKNFTSSSPSVQT